VSTSQPVATGGRGVVPCASLSERVPPMPERDELVHEAAELLVRYRDLSKQTSTADGLGVGVAIARALEALDGRTTKERLEEATRELADVRARLTRIRATLDG
jgi:hypothetical protein